MLYYGVNETCQFEKSFFTGLLSFMDGIIDIGGGMRGIYGAGVLDAFFDIGIQFKYCIGVSSGSANIASYVAGQKGRNLRFYTEYALRKEYMSIGNYLRNGSFFNLYYIYSSLTNDDGEDPIDFDAIEHSDCTVKIAATDSATGKAHFFEKSDFHRNDCSILMASSSIPVVCKPFVLNDKEYFDGGVAAPVPVEKAVDDGCDRVFVILTRPLEYIKPPERFKPAYSLLLKKYPQVIRALNERHKKYNDAICKLKELEAKGRAVIIAPSECFSVNTATRRTDALKKLYRAGQADALALTEYF